MLLSLVYFVLRRQLHAVAPSDRSDLEREAELLVLRDQQRHPRRRGAAGWTGYARTKMSFRVQELKFL
jgi:hypothetical protein